MKDTKMTYSKLALGNLKNRKKQYTLLIIGIILSMFFSSASLFFVASTVSSMEETTVNLVGKTDYILPNADQIDKCEEALEYAFKKVGYGSFMGLAVAPKGETDEGFIITKFDDNAKELFVKILEGHYPQAPDEIAIEKEALLRAGFKEATVGDTITVNLYPQNKDVHLEKSTKKEFKIVGILQNRRVNIERACHLNYLELPAAVVSDDYLISPGGSPSTFALAYNGDNFSIKKHSTAYNDFMKYLDYEDDFLKIRAAEISLYVRYDWELMESVNPIYLAAFFVGMMALVANIGIVTSFSTNLKERKKQIGLLRCVGATKMQIIKIYLLEALVLSLICTPVSVVLALVVTYLAIPFFGEYFVFKPEFWTVPLSIGVSIVIVILSAIIPLISAARISPMQAIRNFDIQRKLKNFKVKISKDFDVSKLIAKRNITLMKFKNNLTSFIICASIFVSCIVLAFAQVDIDELNTQASQYDYVIYQTEGEGISSYMANYEEFNGYSENDLNELLSVPYTDTVLSSAEIGGYIEVPKLTEYMHGLRYLNHTYSTTLPYPANKETAINDSRRPIVEHDYVKNATGIKGETISFQILALDDNALLDLQKTAEKSEIKENIEGKIDIEKMKTGENVILVVPDEIDIMIQQEFNNIVGNNTYISASWGKTTFYGNEDGETLESDYILNRDFTVGQDLKIGCIQANKHLEFGKDLYELGENKVPPVYKKNDFTSKIGAIANNIVTGYAYDLYYTDNVPTIIISHDILDKLTPTADYKSFAVKLNTECTKEIDKLYNDIFEEISLGKSHDIHSNYDDIQDNKNHIYTWIIIVLCIIFVMFTLSGSLVNTSITSRIHQGRKSIGTLRAVGASEKELISSYIRQFVSVMLKGVISGYTLFTAFGLIFYFVGLSYGFHDFGSVCYSPAYKYLLVPLGLITIPAFILFVSCCINMISKIKKEMKNSIVENIREL